jgi:hypothetical protein
MKYILTVLLLATALSTRAEPPTTKSSGPEPKKPADFKSDATMCDSTYALCIKAPCDKRQQVDDKTGKETVKCECVLQTGWNLGPNSCAERKVRLTSTYSNNFNSGSRVLSCPQPVDWAWCYGASCEKNGSKDGKELAVCVCPVINSPAVILVDRNKCGDSADVCSHMWSAAYPAESKFANDYYFWWMHKNVGHTDAPALACPSPAQ